MMTTEWPQHNTTTLNCTFPPSANTHKFSVVLAVLFGIPACIIIVITILGNFLVLCFKARVGKSQTSLLIWNLGLADFLVGVFVLPFGVAYVINGEWIFGRLMCRFWTACDVIFCTASIVTLCVISIDRYIGVTKPLRYKVIVTKTRIVMAIILIWLFSITILLVTAKYVEKCTNPSECRVINELEYVIHSVITAFFLPAAVTLALYWKIYRVAIDREKCLQEGLIIAIGENFLSACVLTEGLRVHCGKNKMSQQRKVIRMHKCVAKTLGVVVTAFILCWLPFFTIYLIAYQCRCIHPIVLDILTWMGYCNSMVNPIIYAFTVSEFKRTIRHLFIAFHWRCWGKLPPSAIHDPRYANVNSDCRMRFSLDATLFMDCIAFNGGLLMHQTRRLSAPELPLRSVSPISRKSFAPHSFIRSAQTEPKLNYLHP